MPKRTGWAEASVAVNDDSNDNSSSRNGVAKRMTFTISAAARSCCAAALVFVLTCSAEAQLTFCCSAENDLFKLVPGAARADSPADAVDRAADGSGVLVLADRYPAQRTDVPGDVLARAKAKHLRLFI